MVKLKPIIFPSILASFKEIARQGYYSSYRYFHSLGYWTQATLDIELIAKVVLFDISYSWTIFNSINILWNFSIQTDHEVINNKPDIIVVDKINKTVSLIEVAVPNDYNICNKPLQKIRAYTNLSGEIKALWNLNKVQIIPVIVGAMRTFYKKIDDDISKLGLTNHKFRVEEAQKIALLGAAHIVRGFLQIV